VPLRFIERKNKSGLHTKKLNTGSVNDPDFDSTLLPHAASGP